MLRARAAVRLALRFGAASLAVLLVVSAFADSADARARKRHNVRHRTAAAQSYHPAAASIVIDANTGAVLQSTNADSPRHPASLTKIMTLYLLFERLESGKLKLTSELPVSPHAAAQAPSKLGLQPGQTIPVETAIKAIVTKSANDVAVVIAEALGGTEEDFAKQMTAKAHALGMVHTAYFNASGLPDDRQITTARDVALLGRSIQERFPSFYHYFSLRTFEYHGKPIRNHNHLLGVVAGVDGIKTGYIHDSGFNIAINLRRGGRHMVVVVFGGRTARARDARVRDLIDDNIARASPKRSEPAVAQKSEPAAPKTRAAVNAPPAPEPGSTAPIKPTPVKTFAVKAGAVKTASLSAVPLPSQKLTATPANTTASITTVATVKRDPPALPPPPGAKPGVLGVLQVKVASANDETASTTVAAKSHSGWMIQVGAFDDESEAKQRLTIAREKAETQLSHAEPFTERVAKGSKTLFRARFAGLEKEQAEAACKHLKRSDIPCMSLKN
ncbi:MAG TPA: D-alanyl-D-alanine carboxypeptidase [Pseudolabrys sp.]|nr:D-alanyl-D-alanine carboxypeptidase [Pseudolabrys sp.]